MISKRRSKFPVEVSQKDVIEAWYIRDKSVPQIASKLGVNEGSLKTEWWKLKRMGLLPMKRKQYPIFHTSARPLPVKVARLKDDEFLIDGRPIIDHDALLEKLKANCPDWKPGDPHP